MNSKSIKRIYLLIISLQRAILEIREYPDVIKEQLPVLENSESYLTDDQIVLIKKSLIKALRLCDNLGVSMQTLVKEFKDVTDSVEDSDLLTLPALSSYKRRVSVIDLKDKVAKSSVPPIYFDF